MEDQVLIVEKKDRVCWITFNRPDQRNSLSQVLLYRLCETLEELKQEGEIRCIVFQGAGDKAFSAGYDIKAIPTNVDPKMMETLRTKNALQMGLEAIINFPYPTIAMINGMAFGAGCELAITCDIRIAADNARLGMPPAKLGLVYMPAGIMRFINVIGWANAKEIFLTGRYYSAHRAKEMNLVNYLVPADQLVPFTTEMAEELSQNAPLSIKGTKAIFRSCLEFQKIDPQRMEEFERIVAECFNSEDLKEAQKAFFEKRKPNFKGR